MTKSETTFTEDVERVRKALIFSFDYGAKDSCVDRDYALDALLRIERLLYKWEKADDAGI